MSVTYKLYHYTNNKNWDIMESYKKRRNYACFQDLRGNYMSSHFGQFRMTYRLTTPVNPLIRVFVEQVLRNKQFKAYKARVRIFSNRPPTGNPVQQYVYITLPVQHNYYFMLMYLTLARLIDEGRAQMAITSHLITNGINPMQAVILCANKASPIEYDLIGTRNSGRVRFTGHGLTSGMHSHVPTVNWPKFVVQELIKPKCGGIFESFDKALAGGISGDIYEAYVGGNYEKLRELCNRRATAYYCNRPRKLKQPTVEVSTNVNII